MGPKEEMVEVKIQGCTAVRFQEVRGIVGARLFRIVVGKSDRDSYVVDYRDRAEADLAVINLNTLHGVHAEIVGNLGLAIPPQ